jgi:hypothetical protein
LAGRFANFIMTEIVPHADYIIDFHTGGAGRFNFSQIRYNLEDKECEELALVFGTKFVMRAETLDRSFRYEASQAGKKVLMFEGGKTMHLDRVVTRSGITGTMRVLHHLGVSDFKDLLDKSPTQTSKSSLVIRLGLEQNTLACSVLIEPMVHTSIKVNA